MSTTDPLRGFGTITTPQSTPIPGRTDQVENSAGGFVYTVDKLSQLRRFLTIGVVGGTYYVSENALTRENGEFVIELTKTVADHRILVDEIVDISVSGRAPKQNPALFALAIACQMGEVESKQYARKQITKVVRTGTHLFIFVGYLKQFGGWGRGLRKAVAAWYEEKDSNDLAYQLVKYRHREGFTHRDVLRMVHPTITDPTKRAAIEWAVKGEVSEENDEYTPDLLRRFNHTNNPNKDLMKSMDGLPWEALPDSAMNRVDVWDKLLDNGMPMTALMRQLSRLTQLGMLPNMGGRTDEVAEMLLNPVALKKARMHPINVLVALKTYRGGQGYRSTWTPTAKIIDALDEMFYASFDFVPSTNKRTMLALDVSGSMGASAGGKMNLSCREVSAAMAMVTLRTEPNHMTVGFTDSGRRRTQGWGWSMPEADLTPLPLSKRQRLDDVIQSISNLPFGGTDCSLPMIEALHKGYEIDTFVIYTDNETWAGNIHPSQALAQYRKYTGIDSKLVVVSIQPTNFSIADPRDPGMLDISGFDSSAPNLISDFSAGRV